MEHLTALEAEAQRLGFPATLFGYTPSQREYWYEPNLPRFKSEMHENPPLDYRGNPSVACFADIAANNMAPRFPRGCSVYTMPVFAVTQLVVGRVYTYPFLNNETGEREWNIARLVKIGGNYLQVASDNPTDAAHRTIWLLREDEYEATWDVREVTHYVSYPALG